MSIDCFVSAGGGVAKDWDSYLLDVLRCEIVSCQSENEALRNSLRYRAGGWLLEALPIGRNTISAVLKLLKLYFRKSARGAGTASSEYAGNSLNQFALGCSVVTFGRECPDFFNGQDVWCTRDASLVARRLDYGGDTGTLVLRNLDVEILKRLVRVQKMGWRVIWCPEMDSYVGAESLVAYAKAHVDQCLEVEGV